MRALTTKVPSDLWDQIEQRADERDITRSKAARDLLYAGLEATSEDTNSETRDTVRDISGAFGAIYIYMWYTGDQSGLVTIFGAYLLVMLLWSINPAVRRSGKKVKERIK